MDLPFTLTEIGYGLSGILVGWITRDFGPWILREWLERRKRRKEWYSEINGIANQINIRTDSDKDFILVPMEDLNRIKNNGQELKRKLNPPFEVDSDIQTQIEQLTSEIDKLFSMEYVQSFDKNEEIAVAQESDNEISEELFGYIKNINQYSNKVCEKTNGKLD